MQTFRSLGEIRWDLPDFYVKLLRRVPDALAHIIPQVASLASVCIQCSLVSFLHLFHGTGLPNAPLPFVSSVTFIT